MLSHVSHEHMGSCLCSFSWNMLSLALLEHMQCMKHMLHMLHMLHMPGMLHMGHMGHMLA